MLEVIQYLQSNGFSVREFIPDGKIHRAQKDNSDTKNSLWYLGFQNHTRSGETFQLVIHGDWSDTSIPQTFHTLKGKISGEDKKFIKKQVDDAVRRAEAEREKVYEQISKEVTEKWDRLESTGTNDYLERKKISGIKQLGIRYDNFSGEIYIPARDATGKIWTLQRITRDGTKLFSRGGRVSSCFHVIGDIKPDGRIYLAEGFATAASIYLATGVATVCSFNSNNIKKIHSEIRKLYPDGEVITCGDEDLWSRRPDGSLYNPGREALEGVSDAIFPVFKNLIEKQTTDFNDLHCHEGIESVKNQLESYRSTREKLAVYALGYDDTGFYFTSTRNKYIMCFSSPGEADLLKLAPIEYWEILFPSRGQTRIDWAQAKSQMIAQAQMKGVFRHTDVRGSGVWIDKDRVVINTGNYLLVDGEKIDLGSFKSQFFYTPGKIINDNDSHVATVKDCSYLINACEGFNWAKPESGKLLAGALVLAKICGAIPIRPHVWVTGAAKTGKTSLMEYVVNPMLGDFGIYAQGNTSEAGIRQTLKNNAVPILLDEFETDGKKTDERVVSLIELMRAAWSDSTASLIKGSSGGRATTFNARFSAIVSSIRCNLTNDADISRFAVLELAPHNSSNKEWEDLQAIMSHIDKNYANSVFCRSIQMLPIILANFKILRAELSKKGGARFGDTYGMLFAGYSILLTDRELTKDDAEFLTQEINLDEQLEESKVTDHEDCLSHLLGYEVSYDTSTGRKMDTIGGLIQHCIKGVDTNADHALQLKGIKIQDDHISIAGRANTGLQSIFKDTKWNNIWGKSLSRFEGSIKNQPVWIIGKSYRCVTLPKKMFKSV